MLAAERPRGVFSRQLTSLRGSTGATRSEAEALEKFDQRRANRLVVVDDEHGERHVAAVGGSVSVSVVPCSGTLSMLMEPPCSSMMRWQSARPIPVPPALVE